MLTDVATPLRWCPTIRGHRYATDDTYHAAAEWLRACPIVEDWGGGFGYLQQFLPSTTTYRVIEGTRHRASDVLADLRHYTGPSDGIVLRHVLDNTADWPRILANACAACRQRLVVVTFTPAVPITIHVATKRGWPITHFNPDDLRAALGALWVRDEAIQTTHPERVYYGERRP